MPIYEYQCMNCGYLFEELQTMSEAALITCPNCGKDELKKLIGTGGGIIFKGSGFYQTDYKKSAGAEKTSDTEKTEKSEKSNDKEKSPKKKESKTEPAISKKETKTESASNSESKIESKPETKTESKRESSKETKSVTKPGKNNKK